MLALGSLSHCFEPVEFPIQELREGSGKSEWRTRTTEPVHWGYGSKPDQAEDSGHGVLVP